MSECRVTILVSPSNGKRNLCGQPEVRYGLGERHAADHERLCDGCERCR